MGARTYEVRSTKRWGRDRWLSPRSFIVGLLTVTTLASMLALAVPVASAQSDCSRWYSPSGSENIWPHETATAAYDYEVRRAPSHSSACGRNVTLTAGTTVEVRGFRGDFAYTRNPANNDYGWVTKAALGLEVNCSSWYNPADDEKIWPYETAQVTTNDKIRRAPLADRNCERGHTIAAGTSVEVRAYRGDFAYTRNPANNDYGWVLQSALSDDSDVNCNDWYSPAEDEKIWPYETARVTTNDKVRRAPLTDRNCERGHTIGTGTTVEVRAYRGDFAYTRNPADNDYGWVLRSALGPAISATNNNQNTNNGPSCDSWYNPSETEKLWPYGTGTIGTDYNVRLSPNNNSDCQRGVIIRQGATVELRAVRGDWVYTRNLATNDYGWITNSALAQAGSATNTTNNSSNSNSNSNNSSNSNSAGGVPTTAAANLAMIRDLSVRNTNHDYSTYAQTRSANLPVSQMLVSWRTYQAAGHVDLSRSVAPGFRVACEFSHFAYDDPIVFPNQPGRAHLHMFFGNTEANAFSTADSMLNSGSSTCNGQELNRTGYWVPAFIDAAGSAIVPDFAMVYYKAYGPAIGDTEVYPPGMRLIAGSAMATSPQPKRDVYFSCTTGTRAVPNDQKKSHIPRCNSGQVLEMTIRFQTCWNGQDPANWQENASISSVWPTSGECPSSHPRHLPQLEYRIFFDDHAGSDRWILSSDVSMQDRTTINSNGYSLHGDWYGGWNMQVNQMWINSCVNTANRDCDVGLLGDPRHMSSALALRLRPEYTGPTRVSGAEILEALCPQGDSFTGQSSVALCG